jgi:hypothetical protein
MPQPFDQAVITDDGETLLAEAAAGSCRIEFCYMAVGNGTYSASEKTKAELKARTALKAAKNTYVFSGSETQDHSVKLKALITNQDPVTGAVLVTQGYYINEVGLYAKRQGEDDSAAVLYSISLTANADGNGDYLPEYNGYNRVEIVQNYIITVDDSTSIVVNVSGAAALYEDFVPIRDLVLSLGLEVVDGKLCTVYEDEQEE